MREPAFAHGASVCPAMLARGAGWGICTGAFFGFLSAATSILIEPVGSVLGILAFLAIAVVIGMIIGSISGLGLGLLGGGLLGLWTSLYPRPVVARADYRMQATPVVGILMGGAVALALGIATREMGYTLFIAIQAGLAAGWSTCRILGWYAAQPE